MTETPKELEGVPLPVAGKNPVRFSIVGICDKIADLKEYVKAQAFDADLRAFIDSELDEVQDNAAQIDMHYVESDDGGTNLHLTISPVHLGAPKQNQLTQTES